MTAFVAGEAGDREGRYRRDNGLPCLPAAVSDLSRPAHLCLGSNQCPDCRSHCDCGQLLDATGWCYLCQCIDCGTRLKDDRCPNPRCVENAPVPQRGRDHRGFLRSRL